MDDLGQEDGVEEPEARGGSTDSGLQLSAGFKRHDAPARANSAAGLPPVAKPPLPTSKAPAAQPRSGTAATRAAPKSGQVSWQSGQGVSIDVTSDADTDLDALKLGRGSDIVLNSSGEPLKAATRVPDQALWGRLATTAGDEAEAAALEQGCSPRAVKRHRKAAEQAELRRLREADKAAAKDAKRAAATARRQAKAAEAASAKAAAKASKTANRALVGGPTDPNKHVVLRLSCAMMGMPWADTLLTTLNVEKYEYVVDPSLPLSSKYPIVRWCRRLPNAAAEAVLQQQAADPMASGGQGALEPAPPVGDDGATTDLFFPLVLTFLSPSQLVQACCGQPQPCSGSSAAPSGQHSQGGVSSSPAAAVLLGAAALGPACGDLLAAFPHCTLLLGCVGLERELTALERADKSTFNRAVVRDWLLDLQISCPGIRLREDLVDGAQAAELVVGASRGLGMHHKKQQEGYLQAFNQGKVGLCSAAVAGLSTSQRTTAAALSHIMSAARAISVCRVYPSLWPLLDALNDPARSVKQREGVLAATCPGEGPGAVGKQSSKNVYDFFSQQDPKAACRPAG